MHGPRSGVQWSERLRQQKSNSGIPKLDDANNAGGRKSKTAPDLTE